MSGYFWPQWNVSHYLSHKTQKDEFCFQGKNSFKGPVFRWIYSKDFTNDQLQISRDVWFFFLQFVTIKIVTLLNLFFRTTQMKLHLFYLSTAPWRWGRRAELKSAAEPAGRGWGFAAAATGASISADTKTNRWTTERPQTPPSGLSQRSL